MIPLRDAAQAAYAEGYWLGAAVAREAPFPWIDAILSGKPRMPDDLWARLTTGSHLPPKVLTLGEVNSAMLRGFWDGLERSLLG